MIDREIIRKMRRGGAGAFLIVAVVSFCMMLAGCSTGAQSEDGNAGAGSDEDLTSVTFVLDWTPNTNHTGIYVAQAEGYYADAGLDVAIVQPPDDGADALVGTGKAQFGMGFQDVMANYLGTDDPLPVTAIAAVVQHNTSGIMSRAGEGADRPAGMAGKEYGTWDQDVEKAILESLVETDGGSWEDVVLVPANSTDEVSGIRADMFDTVWVYEAWGLQNAYLQDYPVDYFSLREVDDTFDYYTPVIIANDDYAAAHPDIVRAFLEATARGYEFAAEYPAEAASILVEAAPEVDGDLALASQEYLADLYIADAPQWGYIDPARWNAFYSWMNDNNLVSTAIPEDAGFTNEYLPEKQG